MADLSNVDSERVLSAASQMDAGVSAMQQCITKLNQAIEALNSGWISSAKSEFMSRYQTDHDALTEMVAQYYEISAQLRDAAQDFDKTESDLISRMSALG